MPTAKNILWLARRLTRKPGTVVLLVVTVFGSSIFFARSDSNSASVLREPLVRASQPASAEALAAPARTTVALATPELPVPSWIGGLTRSVAPVSAPRTSPAPAPAFKPAAPEPQKSTAETRAEFRQRIANLELPPGAKDGQFLMVVNGKAVWSDLPRDVLRGDPDGRQSGTGRRPTGAGSGAGGESSGGDSGGGSRGGGGGGDSAAYVTNNTTVVTGLSQGDADGLYVNDTGDTIDGDLVIVSDGIGLTVRSTLSGSVIKADSLLTSSGGLTVEGAVQFKALTNCNTIDTDADGNLSCGTDEGGAGSTYNAGQGLSLTSTTFSLRSTITGSLVRFQTVSGSILHANTQLRSSGSLVVEGAATFSNSSFRLLDSGFANCTALETVSGVLTCGTDADTNTQYRADQGLTLTGTGFSLSATISGTLLEFQTVSGAIVHGNAQLRSSGSLIVDGAATFNNSSFRLLDSGFANCTALETVNGVLTCGTDGGSGTSYRADQGLTLTGTGFSLASTISGTLLEFQTVSGAIVHGNAQLRGSGTLALEGNAILQSGLRLASGGFNSCGTLTTDSSGNLVCSSSSSGTAGQGLSLNGSTFSVNATLTGTLIRFQTLSGSILHAKNSLRSSGTLVVDSTGLVKGNLTTRGTLSGVLLTVSNLRNCNTLDTDAQGVLSCGTDETAGSGLDLNTADNRYIKKQGDTMTGGLLLQTGTLHGTLPTIDAGLLLEVSGTASGRTLHAQDQLRSSGSLAVDGATYLNNATVVFSAFGNCTALAVDSTGNLLCTSDDDTNTQYHANQGLTLTGTGFSLSSTISGTLLEFQTVSGAIVHANTQLRSSGSLIVDGAATFNNSSFRLLDSGFANCSALETVSGVLTCGTDTDTTYIAGKGLTLTGNAFSTNATLTGTLIRFTTLSGSTLFAKNELNASGSVIVDGAATFNNSSFRLLDSGFANCTALETVSGVLTCGTDSGSSYVAGKGLTLTGDTFSTNATLTGTLIRFTTLSGSTIYSKNELNASGSVIVEGAATFNNSSFRLLDSGFANCSALETVSGVLTCGSDADTTYIAGKGLTLTGNAFSTNATLTGTLIRFTTLSGSTLFAKNELNASGALIVEGISTFNGNLFIGDSSSDLMRVRAQLSGSLVPNASNLYSLGSSTNRWKDLFLSGASLHVGDNGDEATIGFNTALNYLDLYSGKFIILSTGNVGIGTTSPGSKLSVSGSLIVGSSIGSAAADSGLAAEVIGTLSGRTLHAQDGLRSSGSLVVDGSSVVLGHTNFANCDTLDTVNGVLTCGTDAGGVGLDQNGGDARYVNTAGDTMTGALTIDNQLRVGSGYLLSTNLVGHWKFNETSGTTATDSSSTANNGTLSGSTVPTRVLGKLSKALYLNGTTAFVDVPDNAVYDLSTFTLAAWVRTSNATGDDRVISQQNGGAYWGMGLQSGKLRYFSSLESIDTTAGPALNDGEWHHIAAKRINASSYALYVDGREVLNLSGGVNSGTFNIAANVNIGRYSGNDEYFAGNIDDVRVYSRALSAGEIRQLAGTLSIEGALNVEGGATFNANTLVIDDAGGRVGIGTANPGTALTILKDSTISTSGTDGLLNITAGTSFDSTLGAAISMNGISTGNPGDLVLYAGNGAGKIKFITTAEKMTILQNGNVGIGNLDPQTVLDVTGTFRSTGVVTITNYVGCTILTTDGSGTLTCGAGDVAYSGEGNAQFTNDAAYVTADSTNTFTNKSGNISQWTNDSGYMTASSSNDLTNKTGNISQWTNDSGYITAASASDLTNKTGNISQWTNNSGYITAASASDLTNKTGNISQWTNDSAYVTAASSTDFTNKTGNISQWTNNSGYITASSTDTLTNKSGAISQWTNDSGYYNADDDVSFNSIRIGPLAGCGDAANEALETDAEGDIYCGDVTSGSDLAEFYPTSDDELGTGDIVMLDGSGPQFVSRASGGQGRVIGVVSTEPGLELGRGEDFGGARKLPIALAGRIPVKVVGDTGPIAIGDGIALSAIPGVGRRALENESIVGYALEAFDGVGQGSILVFLHVQDAASLDGLTLLSAPTDTGSGTTFDAFDLQGLRDRLSLLEVRVQNLSGSLTSGAVDQDLEDRIAELEAAFSGSNLRFGELSASTLNLEETLMVGRNARIAGDLELDGALRVAELFVPGTMTVDGALAIGSNLSTETLEVRSDAVINGTLTLRGSLLLASGSSLSIGSGSEISLENLIVRSALRVIGPITIEGLAQFLGDVEVHGELSVSARQAGFALIPEGGTGITVRFDPPMTHQPVVTASPDVPVLYAVQKMSATGFTIRLAGPALEPVTFSWQAVGMLESLESSESSDSSESSQSSQSSSSSGTAFPVDALGVPVSTNDVWNACIRNQTMLDDAGLPLSCARYHDGYVWEHPDLLIFFTWNTQLTPPLLQLPDGYTVTVTGGGASASSDASSSDVSSSSSSEASSSSSSSDIPEAPAASSSSSEEALPEDPVDEPAVSSSSSSQSSEPIVEPQEPEASSSSAPAETPTEEVTIEA